MDPRQLASELTDPQRRTLRRRQRSLFPDPAEAAGHGMTMRALRARGIIEGAMPHAKVTDLGEQVCAIAQIDGPENVGDPR